MAVDIITMLLILACILVSVVVMAGILWIIFKNIIKKGKNGIMAFLYSMICILIAVCGWIFNFGWLRFFLTFMLVPFIHTIAFFIMNICSFGYMNISKTMKISMYLFYVTYILPYIFLPDGGDYGSPYIFFGLIHNDAAAFFGNFVANIAIALQLVTFIIQINEIRKYNKQERLRILQQEAENQ